mmetsp:Transcript_6434/g.6649  ORF Transcript_6434/g.6649 Transcript_6434/m.6649 type:complete len:666 (+) Transcript_6434:113-2110(+)
MLPLIVQFRLICKIGLLKGCLLCTSDENLCPEDGIIVRKSMKKAASPHIYDDRKPCYLYVNNTFESPQLSERHGNYDTLQDSYAALSRQSIIVLSVLGVPEQIFLELMDSELLRVINMTTDRQAAYDVVTRYVRSQDFSEHGDKEKIEDELVESKDEENSENIELYLSSSLTSSAHTGVKALRFLTNGHDLQEPMLAQYLRQIQHSQLRRLQRCNMRLRNATYLVGAPDPYGLLREGEVYVSLPNDHRTGEMNVSFRRKNKVLGQVAVFRNPLYHSGDVRVLCAVDCEKLSDFVQDTSGGVVFFSIQGSRSEGDKMSGGDYDGDAYMVIYTSKIVDYIRQQAPYTKAVTNTISASKVKTESTNQEKDRRSSIMMGIMATAKETVVGKYTNAWLSWLDKQLVIMEKSEKGIKSKLTDNTTEFTMCPEALRCHEIVMTALDAAKTGEYMRPEPGLLKVDRPHYLKSGSNTYTSISVLGKLYDKAQGQPDKYPSPMSDNCIVELHHDNDGRTSRWKQHFSKYRLDLSKNISKQHATNNMKFDKIYYQSILQQYIKEYDNESRNLVIRHCKKFYKGMWEGQKSSHPQNKRVFISIWELARQSLAATVYKVVYDVAEEKYKDNKNYALSFCWEICGTELHAIKREAVLRKSKQSSLSGISDIELKYLCQR